MQCRTGTNQSQNIRIVVAVRGERAAHDLNFVQIVEREQRTNWPVDQARRQRFLGGWAGFALDVTARKFPCRVGLFAVINGEREEVAFWIHATFNGGDKNQRFAKAHHDSSVGLLGKLTCFKNERDRTERQLQTRNLHDVKSLVWCSWA